MAEKLTPAQLVKKISSDKDCPPALLILASDEIRKDRIEKLLLNAFLKPASGELSMARSVVDGRELDAHAIRRLKEDLSSISLFSPRRFFILRHAQELSTEVQKLLVDLLEKGSQDNRLIIEGTALPSTSPLKKHFVRLDLLIELEDMEEQELARWTEKELKAASFNKVPPDVVPLLIDIAEGAPDRIVKSIEQLSLYTGSDQLSRDDIQSVFVQHTAPGEFDFIDALSLGRPARAETLLHGLLASGKNPFMLMSLISRTFSNYLAIKACLADGLSGNEVRQKLNIQPWVFNKHINAVRPYSVDKLKRIMEDILKADSKLKNRSLGVEAIFSELIYSCALSRP